MRLYTGQHQFYRGVDLHARTIYTRVLDARGRTVLDRDLPASPDAFLDAVQPHRYGPAGRLSGFGSMTSKGTLLTAWPALRLSLKPGVRSEDGVHLKGSRPELRCFAPSGLNSFINVCSKAHAPGQVVPPLR